MKNTVRMAVSALLALLIVPLLVLPAGAFGPSDQKLYSGIDVSEWQGDIDFARVKASGISVVYIRAGEGNEVKDAKFEANYAGAKKNGLHIGFYYYVTAKTTAQAKAQARFFAELLEGKDYDCMPAMDFEALGNLSNEEVNQLALTFMQTLVQATQKQALVYSNLYNAKHVFDARLAAYPLWIAEYGVNEPGDPGHWKTWAGFQHSDTGRVPGISGNVDLDQFTDGVFLTDAAPVPTGGGGVMPLAAVLMLFAAAAAAVLLKRKTHA